jgi:hypothetical protein
VQKSPTGAAKQAHDTKPSLTGIHAKSRPRVQPDIHYTYAVAQNHLQIQPSMCLRHSHIAAASEVPFSFYNKQYHSSHTQQKATGHFAQINTHRILLPSLFIASRERAAFSLTTAIQERGKHRRYIGSAFGIRPTSRKLNSINLNSSPSNRLRRSPSPMHVPVDEDNKSRWPSRSSRGRVRSIPIRQRLLLRDVPPKLCFTTTIYRRDSLVLASVGDSDAPCASTRGTDSTEATSNAAK